MRNVIFLMVILLVCSINTTAQVTIGSDQPPRAGAGLDLRSNDKGLLLPNVSLSDPATDFQLDGGASATAAGMVVYNISAELDGPGVYVWSGMQWILITCVPEIPGTIEFSETTVIQNGTFTASVPEVSGPAAATEYIWSVPAGEMEITGANNGRTITVKANAVNTYAANAITVQAKNACGTSGSQVSLQTIIVRDCSAAPTISSPATDETKITKQGTALPADLSVTAEGKGASVITFRWEKSTNLSAWNFVDGETNATFTAPVTEAGTTYYRCVVTTACGSATSKIFTVNVCGTFIEDIEENWYCYGDFGAAGTWMTMNLRSTYNDIYTNLTANFNAASDASLKYYWYPDNNPTAFTSHPEYGLLYTWAAASGRTVNTSEGNSNHTKHQGICPSGWHLPSDYEWSALEKEIATNPQKYSSQTTQYATAGSFNYGGTTNYRPDSGTELTYWGRQMKSRTTVNGLATNGTSNGLAANGFDALTVGYVENGKVPDRGNGAAFWSSSSYSSSAAWYRTLHYSVTGMRRDTINAYKYYMFSVRCKKTE